MAFCKGNIFLDILPLPIYFRDSLWCRCLRRVCGSNMAADSQKTRSHLDTVWKANVSKMTLEVMTSFALTTGYGVRVLEWFIHRCGRGQMCRLTEQLMKESRAVAAGSEPCPAADLWTCGSIDWAHSELRGLWLVLNMLPCAVALLASCSFCIYCNITVSLKPSTEVRPACTCLRTGISSLSTTRAGTLCWLHCLPLVDASKRILLQSQLGQTTHGLELPGVSLW